MDVGGTFIKSGLMSADGNLIPWRHLFHFVPEREIP